MAIKHIVVRTQDGHAYDPTRPGCRFNVGIGAQVEVLATSKTDRVRVSVDGVECKGNPPRFIARTEPGKAKLLIEQIADNAVIDAIKGEVEIIAAPAEPVTSPAAKPAAAKATPEPAAIAAHVPDDDKDHPFAVAENDTPHE